VVTAFMQGQGHLLTLAEARWYLFKAFCFPTMVKQTTQQFVWIIKIDPLLMELAAKEEEADKDKNKNKTNNNVTNGTTSTNTASRIVQEMIELLKPYPNFMLVGTNDHSRYIGQDFPRYINKLYVGNPQLLQYVHSLFGASYDYETTTAIGNNYNHNLLLLQTKLDSDDGLNLEYLESLKKLAKKQVKAIAADTEKRSYWRIWCITQHLEWHSSFRTANQKLKQKKKKVEKKAEPKIEGEIDTSTCGITKPGPSRPGYCITPGLTIMFSHPGVSFPEYMKSTNHGLLMINVKKHGGCGLSHNNTMDCINVSKRRLGAVRVRTVTSHGMNGNVHSKNETDTDKKELRLNLKLLNAKFGISKDDVREANQFINEQSEEISADNKRGRCTAGHSCKGDKNKEFLDSKIQAVLNSTDLLGTVLSTDQYLFQMDIITDTPGVKQQWLIDVQDAQEQKRLNSTSIFVTPHDKGSIQIKKQKTNYTFIRMVDNEDLIRVNEIQRARAIRRQEKEEKEREGE